MGLNRLMTYIHHYSVMQSIFTALKILCSFHCPKNPPFISSSPPTSKNHGYFYCMPFRECHIVGIIQYVAFSDWLLSLSNMHLWFLPISSRLDSSFLFLVCSLSCVWLFATPWRLQYTRLSCPLLSPRVCSNSCPLSHWWCHPTISSPELTVSFPDVSLWHLGQKEAFFFSPLPTWPLKVIFFQNCKIF